MNSAGDTGTRLRSRICASLSDRTLIARCEEDAKACGNPERTFSEQECVTAVRDYILKVPSTFFPPTLARKLFFTGGSKLGNHTYVGTPLTHLCREQIHISFHGETGIEIKELGLSKSVTIYRSGQTMFWPQTDSGRLVDHNGDGTQNGEDTGELSGYEYVRTLIERAESYFHDPFLYFVCRMEREENEEVAREWLGHLPNSSDPKERTLSFIRSISGRYPHTLLPKALYDVYIDFLRYIGIVANDLFLTPEDRATVLSAVSVTLLDYAGALHGISIHKHAVISIRGISNPQKRLEAARALLDATIEKKWKYKHEDDPERYRGDVLRWSAYHFEETGFFDQATRIYQAAIEESGKVSDSNDQALLFDYAVKSIARSPISDVQAFELFRYGLSWINRQFGDSNRLIQRRPFLKKIQYGILIRAWKNEKEFLACSEVWLNQVLTLPAGLIESDLVDVAKIIRARSITNIDHKAETITIPVETFSALVQKLVMQKIPDSPKRKRIVKAFGW